jgi:hypothetical protein
MATPGVDNWGKDAGAARGLQERVAALLLEGVGLAVWNRDARRALLDELGARANKELIVTQKLFM